MLASDCLSISIENEISIFSLAEKVRCCAVKVNQMKHLRFVFFFTKSFHQSISLFFFSFKETTKTNIDIRKNRHCYIRKTPNLVASP